MATIINGKGTIKNRKLISGILFCILSVVVFLLFLLSKKINPRYYYFLLFINILITLASAYYGVKFFHFLPYKDGLIDHLNKLKEIPNKFCILHAIMINDEKYRAYFEFIIISPQKIYFINLSGVGLEKQRIYNRLINKIIKEREIELGYKTIYSEKDFNNLINQLIIQQEEKISKQQLDTINKIQVLSL